MLLLLDRVDLEESVVERATRRATSLRKFNQGRRTAAFIGHEDRPDRYPDQNALAQLRLAFAA